MQTLFEVLAGPLARPTTPGVRFGPYRTVPFDGCSSIKVPDSERNRDWLGRCPRGGYPRVELMTLVETGTRAVIAAVFGPTREGETSYATRLLHHLGPDMPVLWDCGFDGNDGPCFPPHDRRASTDRRPDPPGVASRQETERRSVPPLGHVFRRVGMNLLVYSAGALCHDVVGVDRPRLAVSSRRLPSASRKRIEYG
ncbi:hypothetical protein ACFYXP_10380 [Streptomyces sp. NPDC002466]|uniref:hypothetical protein n=1 Tax=unclassified Streptomyces TaxID=2593676 RepID=UPI0011E7C32E|nr:hypothetical protein [Streptomyces sp. sk2.1]TXS71645.1 hypothetical protein EAO76_21335 [Streptomyces sp. sk2.1]